MKKYVCICFIMCFCFLTFRVTGQELGDVNNDESVDIVDALLTAQYYVGLNPTPFYTSAADTSGDGSIDIVDALLIAQFYVGLIPGFPGAETPGPTQIPTEVPVTPEPTLTPTPRAQFPNAFLVGSLETGTGVRYAWYQFEVKDNYLYAQSENQGINIFNVSDPLNPVYIKHVPIKLQGNNTGMTISGNYLYSTSTNTDTLTIVDISDPLNPIKISETPAEFNPRKVVVSGNYAYIASYGGLRIMDISIPANPVMVYTNTVRTQDFVIRGDYAYLLTEIYGDVFIIMDISNPEVPFVAGQTPISSGTRLVVSGDYCYVSYYKQFITVDISNPAIPVSLAENELPLTSNVRSVTRDIKAINNHIYLTNGFALVTVDVANQAAPLFRGDYQLPRPLYDLETINNYLCVLGNSIGFGSSISVYSLQNPGYPLKVSEIDAVGLTNDILVSGNIAYISDRYGGLKIVDVSAPVSPALLSHVPTTDARNVAVSNNMAYVADMTGGIKIIDVTNPQNPNQLSQVDLDEPGDVAVKNNIAYVADRPYGLSVVDVSNPNNPVVLYKAAPDALPVATPTPFALRMTIMPSPVPDPIDIEISGNYLYMLQTIRPVVRVIDISAPSSPVEVSSINTPGSLDIDILGNTFFASCYYADMSVYDIGTPFVPVEYPELPDSQGRQMTIIGNYLFQTQNPADDFKGIQVIDISDPMSMQHLGEIDIGCHATDVFGYNNYLFVTCDYSDKLMMIYRIE